MNKSEKNKVRDLVHGFLQGDLTTVEFREELNRITGRNTSRNTRRTASDTMGTPRTFIQDRASVGEREPTDTP